MASFIRNLTGPGITSPFGFEGADLGYCWDTGQDFCMAVFGDTFESPTPDDGAGWRSPVALRTSTPGGALAKGIVWDNAVGGDYAKQLFDYERSEPPNYGDQAFTLIPNDGVTLPDGRHVIGAFAVGDWCGGPGGTWRTNFVELFGSDQVHGEVWDICWDQEIQKPHFRWYNHGRDRWFQNQSYFMRGDYLYVFGTPSGRQSGAGVYLMRAPWRYLDHRSAWQWWGYDGRWSWGDHEPSAIFYSLCPASAIGEINVRELDGTLVLSYVDGGFCWTRTAAAPDGEWTPPKPQATAIDIPALYAPAIHPWSHLEELHLLISQWRKRSKAGGVKSVFYGTRQWQANAVPVFASIRQMSAWREASSRGRQTHLIADNDVHQIADVISELGAADVSVDTIRYVLPGAK